LRSMSQPTYAETLEFLYRALPMFQRVGAVAYKKDLTNTLALCAALGNPHHRFKSIHIAGTNGKGSTSHMMASVLQEAGYKTGLYTSPHLKEFTERIRVNGEEVTRDFVVDFVRRIKPEIERIQPSFFEITVAMAFDYFARTEVDVAVIEVGLGGRLDSTNVITPLLSVITNIGMDHKDLLGDTLDKIAFEKAGVIKPGVPVVVSERQDAVHHVFDEKASTTGSPLMFASDVYDATWHGDGTLDIHKHQQPWISRVDVALKGAYQKKNVPAVLMACDVLNTLGFDLSRATVQAGLVNVVRNTHLKGRWQQLGDSPVMVCDTGHNAEGITEVLQQLRKQSYRRLIMVWGMVKDKDPEAVLGLLPKHAYYIFCQASIPRALPADDLKVFADQTGLWGEVVPNVQEAVRKAQSLATPDDFIFIGGSTFVVAEIEQL
jgi:dihydrofolate synthase/folylpolyglutamate synthase